MSINQINYLSSIIGFSLINIVLYLTSGKFEGDNQSRSIFVSMGGNTFHLHHWIIGLISLVVVLILEQFFGRSILISMLKGIAIGSIFHGLSFYLDYFKIIK